jgi:hypothetical protein
MDDTEVQGVGWFRHDNRMRHDAKIRALNDQAYRLWNTLMEMASEIQQKGVVHFVPGVPFTDEQLSDEAKIPLKAVRPSLDTMRRFQMIEEHDDCLFVTNFAKRQYQSDVSTGRVKQFRERNRNGDETFQKRSGNDGETPPDTDTDTDTDNTPPNPRKRVDNTRFDNDFEEWWTGYPHPPADDKTRARNNYRTLRRKGVDAERLTRCRDNYAAIRAGEDRNYHKKAANFLGSKDGVWETYEEPVVKEEFASDPLPRFVKPAAKPIDEFKWDAYLLKDEPS